MLDRTPEYVPKEQQTTKGGTNLDFFRGIQVALERCYPALAVAGVGDLTRCDRVRVDLTELERHRFAQDGVPRTPV